MASCLDKRFSSLYCITINKYALSLDGITHICLRLLLGRCIGFQVAQQAGEYPLIGVGVFPVRKVSNVAAADHILGPGRVTVFLSFVERERKENDCFSLLFLLQSGHDFAF